MNELDSKATQEMQDAGLVRLREFKGVLHASKLHSWHWCAQGREEAAEWLLSHPHEIRRGVYLSDSPEKEVWRLPIPSRYGGQEVVVKTYLEARPFLEAFIPSIARNEALNYAVLEQLGIPAAQLVACGEKRSLGRTVFSYIVTGNVPNTVDGSVFMPGGPLWEDRQLCMTFAHKAADILARMHQCHFYHGNFNPRKLLIGENSSAEDLQITLIDVSTAHFKSWFENNKALIAKDILTFVSELRMSSHEIQDMCNGYLAINSSCGFTPDTLWQTLTTN